MDKERRNELLRNITFQRMIYKGELANESYLLKQGKYRDREINRLLDKIKQLDDIERELRKK